MNNYIYKLILIFALLAASAVVYAKPSKGTNMYTLLNPTPLKEKASALSSKIYELEYGTMVVLAEEKGSWAFVYDSNDYSVCGWVPRSALSKKKVTAELSKTTANADEIALAGKGFTSAIEAVYANEYSIDYSDVDFVEKNSIKDDDILDFIQDGKLFVGGAENE